MTIRSINIFAPKVGEKSSRIFIAIKEGAGIMITKRKLRDKIIHLQYRIQELEERICPCGQHDYIKIETEWEDMPAGSDMISVYQCKRCGKKSRVRI